MEKDFEFIKQGNPLIIAVDFDDTLAKVGEKYPEIGEPIYLLATLIAYRRIFKEHLQIILWTCREDEYLDQALEYCKRHGLTFDAVNEEAPATLKWKPKGRKPYRLICAVNDWVASDKTAFGVTNGVTK